MSEREREREREREPNLMQVLQSQSYFSDVDAGMAFRKGPHLVKVSEHFTTTHIV